MLLTDCGTFSKHVAHLDLSSLTCKMEYRSVDHMRCWGWACLAISKEQFQIIMVWPRTDCGGKI